MSQLLWLSVAFGALLALSVLNYVIWWILSLVRTVAIICILSRVLYSVSRSLQRRASLWTYDEVQPPC